VGQHTAQMNQPACYRGPRTEQAQAGRSAARVGVLRFERRRRRPAIPVPVLANSAAGGPSENTLHLHRNNQPSHRRDFLSGSKSPVSIGTD
jgi:hypothetical protein